MHRILIDFYSEHPFNFKRGGMVFSESKIFFSASQRSRIFFRDNITLFLNNIFKAQSANRIFVLPISEVDNFFSIKFDDRIFFPKKTISPPPSLQGKWMFPENNTLKFQSTLYMYLVHIHRVGRK